MGQILNDPTEITNVAQAAGLAENRLPSIFSAAQAWRACLRSELEAGAALSALVERVDLTDANVRVSLKLPITDEREQSPGNAGELTLTRVFPMRIRRRGLEMRLVIEGSGAPAARADLAAPGQNLNPDVLMMKAAEDWYRCDAADLLRPPKIRRILVQREMRPDLVVIGSAILQNATQLRFVEDDQVIEAFAPNRSDEALDVAVLPR